MERQLIVISGMSGAGKTTASNFLEDMGYKCIDQYPAELLEDLIELLENDESAKYEKVALTISLPDLDRYGNLLSNVSLDPMLILLDCDSEEVIRRYKFTRRVHPLMLSNAVTTLTEAVMYEKELMEKYKTRNCHIIDTTRLTTRQHQEKLQRIISNSEETRNLAITFESFGFKYGVPDDADFVFDTRVLDNPFYVEELKNLTGLDKPVRDYVLNGHNTKEYLEKLISYLDMVFKSYGNEEKRHITVCIGCTGGQHRSVTVTEYLYEHYQEEYMCYYSHRELKKL